MEDYDSKTEKAKTEITELTKTISKALDDRESTAGMRDKLLEEM